MRYCSSKCNRLELGWVGMRVIVHSLAGGAPLRDGPVVADNARVAGCKEAAAYAGATWCVSTPC